MPPGIQAAGAPDSVVLSAILAVHRAMSDVAAPTAVLSEVATALRDATGCRNVTWLRATDDGVAWETVATAGTPRLLGRSLPGALPAPGEVVAETAVALQDGSVAVPVVPRASVAPYLLTVSPPRGGWGSPPDDLLKAVAATTALALEAADARSTILHHARVDQLTGLGNRSGFTERTALERERCVRYRHPLAVLLLDLDGFKRVNDRLGHSGGDELIVAVADAVRREVRAMDYAARLGGDEFGIVLPQTEAQQAMVLAERLRTAIKDVPLANAHGVTVSVGVASHAGEESGEALVHRADVAMYAAKGAGRNRCSMHPNDERGLVIMESPELDEVDILTVRALIMAVDAKDAYTHHHSRAVGEIARAVAEELDLPTRTVRYLHLAGVLHDVGKIGISTDILTKPTPLTDIEWLELKAHVHIGERILRGIGLSTAAVWIRHHHESVDGSGYPDGLIGEAIPLPSRVLLVADAFDAMVSTRVYRAGRPPEAAMEEIESLAGRQFDPECALALRRALTRQPDLWSLHERRPFLI